MARAPYKLPSVFVGCPYSTPFKFQTFKNALDELPFRWYYADTRLSTKHLLGILTSYIKAVDFRVFDISLWNPNVALEIGLAEGLGMEYYILLNRNLSKGVPSDIQGLQRIEYDDPKGYDRDDLIPSLVRYLVRDYTHPRNIWDALGTDNRDRKYYFALAILSHFRENKRLSPDDLTRLSRGTYLRRDSQQDVLQKMFRLGLLSDPSRHKYVTMGKNLFPEALKLK